MKVDIQTKMITLLGKPLGQSFAAAMQNNVYQATGINMLYFYTETTPEYLKDIIGGIRQMNYAGFAVTKPNKIEVLQYLDALDPICEKIGACNTVVCTPEGKLVGYNTDCIGFYTALVQDGNVQVKGSTAFCAGAGGVGRPICFSLAENEVKRLYITDLYETAAQAMAADLKKHFEALEVVVVPFGDFSCLADVDLVINASGVGMGHSVGTSPFPPEALQPHQFCFDACYNPAKTQFLLDAEAKGCRTLNGLSMSLYQGAAQIELWAGQKIPLSVMQTALEDAMQSKKKEGSL